VGTNKKITKMAREGVGKSLRSLARRGTKTNLKKKSLEKKIEGYSRKNVTPPWLKKKGPGRPKKKEGKKKSKESFSIIVQGAPEGKSPPKKRRNRENIVKEGSLSGYLMVAKRDSSHLPIRRKGYNAPPRLGVRGGTDPSSPTKGGLHN